MAPLQLTLHSAAHEKVTWGGSNDAKEGTIVPPSSNAATRTGNKAKKLKKAVRVEL
jgi:hypothetical protein